jgi:NAD+ synthase (glutamine-hydrolysing)
MYLGYNHEIIIKNQIQMKSPLSLLVAQINLKVGDIQSNTDQVIDIIRSKQKTHDVIIFPELTLSGYPPEDILLHSSFHHQINQALSIIQSNTQSCYVVIGHPFKDKNHCIFNRVSIFYHQQCVLIYDKHHLPNYGVFDEKRYFTPGSLRAKTLGINGHRVGVCICEDLWQPGPVEKHIENQTELLILINASPFDTQKMSQREQLLQYYASQGIALAYINLVGGQDELIFDGQSMVFNAKGELKARLPAFISTTNTITYTSKYDIHGPIAPLVPREKNLYDALCMGLQDYVKKNGFQSVLIGLSGGIDSALTLAIAADALGPEQVHAILMPSRYTAEISNEDAIAEVHALGVHMEILPIEPLFEMALSTLQPIFKDCPVDLTEENIQARARGLLLMALSNKTGRLVLTTSNKSEIAVGYATLYGDMCGGFSVLKDIFKTEVYALARYRNQLQPVIPQRVLERAPSAELRFDQTDQDHLPDYTLLDQVLSLIIEQKQSISEIVALGFEEKTVRQIMSLISKNEYKRKQAAPGVKISTCAFGKDWRYPITSGFKNE